jgi:hypothetical protein
LGCPIDLDFDPANPKERGYGWMLDDNRPTLTLKAYGSAPQTVRFLVGMHDYDSGLDMDTFTFTADIGVDGNKAGTNLAPLFKKVSQGVWGYDTDFWTSNKIYTATVTVSVRDRQGNETRIVRTMSIGKK